MSPKALRIAGGVAIALALLAGLYFVAIESGVTRIRKVEIIGLTGNKAQRLRAAALSQSTLSVDEDALRNAIGGAPPIRSLRVETSFPDRATITVDLFLPVAAVGPSGSKGVAVSADGTVLQGVGTNNLPKIEGETLSGAVQGREIHDLLAALAAAPDELRGRVASVTNDPKRGVVMKLDRGPIVYMGAPSELEQKWAALARVLADQAFVGASYVDVRVPRRPAVGGVQGGVTGGIDPADPNKSLGDVSSDPAATDTSAGTADQTATDSAASTDTAGQ